jgi:Tfp pilus assembly protein PilW
MLIGGPFGRAATEESGFTLVETLVALVSGLVVLGAAFAILEISLHQSSRVADVAQATQLGRNAMTRLVDELHSACLSPGFAPVQTGSEGSKLIFIDAFSEKSEIGTASAETSGKGAYKHEIVWNPATETLTDFVYPSTGGTSPKFTYGAASPAAGVRFGEKITKVGGTTPIFQYFQYTKEASTSATEPLSTLESKALSVPLTESSAANAASIQINFNAAPIVGGFKSSGRTVDYSSQVTFAFSAPDIKATISQAPCE